MKKIIIGDLHGNFGAIQIVLDKAKYDPSQDTIIFVGDYVDGFQGDDFSAKKTVDYILKLKEENPNVITLIGNHDWWFLDWIRSGDIWPLDIWYSQGGKETILSYGVKNPDSKYNMVKKHIPQSHIEFFENLIPGYYDDEIVVVHGGFANKMDMLNLFENAPLGEFTLKYPMESASMYMSSGITSKYPIFNILWDRDFYKTGVKSLLESYKDIFGDRIFICGHTPRGPSYTNKTVKRILIDSGSKGGGKLSALIVKDGKTEIVSEDDLLYINTLIV